MSETEQTSCNSWLVIGCSAGASRQAKAAIFKCPRGTKIITAARGILVTGSIGVTIDYHLVFSARAEKAYRLAYKNAQRKGTKIIACDWDGPGEPINAVEAEIGPPKPMLDPGYVYPCEIVVPVRKGDVEDHDVPSWSRNESFVGQSDGLMALQFALNDGADQVALAGFEGFTSSSAPYVDGPVFGDDALTEQFFNFWYAVMFNKILASCPATKFTMFGIPTHDIFYPDNLNVISVPVTTAPTPAAAETPVADPG